jgi:HSP20 family molecular chaperone IbpA
MADTKTNTTHTAIEKRQNPESSVNVPARAESAPTYYTPLVDVIENADGFVFQADLPGVKAGDVDVSYENGTLTIEAKVTPRQPANHDYLWREYGVGHFYRSFDIETPVDADGVKAQMKNGVLELYVPKADVAKTRKIDVQTA